MEQTQQDFSNLLPTLSDSELNELEQVLLSKAKQKINEEELDNYFTWVKAVWLNARNEPLDFEKHKYLVDIYQDQHPNIIYEKASQMGLSERLISESVWVCDRLSKNVLYVFPTSSQLNDFVQARLEPVFMQSDYLSRITGVLTADEKRRDNLDEGKKIQKVGLKQIGSAFMYLRGSQNQQQIISVDSDAICLDERDRFIQEHVPYIDKRLLHSTLKWRREASTPTFPGMGINEGYINSDQRIWMLICNFCDLEQEMDFFFNVDFDKKITICKKCKKPIDRLKQGRWVAQNPKNKEVHGYKISGIYNPINSLASLIDHYEKAQVNGFSAMQQFYNQVLGLPYEAEGKTLLTTELDACKQNYEIPFSTSDCFAGADVGERINVIVAKKIKNKLRYVWVGTVSNFQGPADSLEWLMDLYNVRMLMVDAKPETRKVRELIEKYPNRVMAVYYPVRKFDVQNYYVFDDFKSEAYVDRTISLDYLVADFQNEMVELPSNVKAIPEFYEQMTASIRINEINGRTKQMEARWIERGADHYNHAANYLRLASLKGATAQALLDSYQEIINDKDIKPNSIAGWANLVRSRGVPFLSNFNPNNPDGQKQ